MGVQWLERRKQIESLYHHLELVRANMKSLITNNHENFTPDNIQLLEIEEEKILSRIVKLKTLAQSMNLFIGELGVVTNLTVV